MDLAQLIRQFMMTRSLVRLGTNQSNKKTFTLVQNGLAIGHQTGTALSTGPTPGLNSYI
jgi:hypothetical protein